MLGPLEVISGGQPISLGGSKQRATLGYLLLHPNQTVPISKLLKALWSVEEAPMTARKILQNSIWSLRRKLVTGAAAEAPVALRTQPPGYSLDVALERVDLHLFHRWVRDGRARLEAGEPDAAATLLNDALELWRGPALADLTEVGMLWPELTTLQNMRLDVLEDVFEAQLACGRHYAVLGELESLVENEPLRERACGQLMRALYRCGRQSDALGVFSRLRARLVDELGLEPSRELQQLQQAILTHDLALQLAPAPGPYSVQGTAALLPGTTEVSPRPLGPRAVPDGPAPASPQPSLQNQAPRPHPDPAPRPHHLDPAGPRSAPVPTLTLAEIPPQSHATRALTDGRSPAQPRVPVQGSGPGPDRPALRAVLPAPAPASAPAPKVLSPVNGAAPKDHTAAHHAPARNLPAADTGTPTVASAVRGEASLLLVRAEPDPATTEAGELDAVMDGVATLIHQEIERCGGTVVFSLHALTLALFPAEPADPDDTEYPLRAARAATALRTALTASPARADAPVAARTELRTAVATGAVLVSQSLGGNRPPRVYGATVKECEALLALATPDGTHVCDRTRQETREHFAYEEIPGSPVRWKLLGPIDPEPADDDAHHRELDLLQGVMTHSNRWSQPHLITVLSTEEAPRRRMLDKLGDFAATALDGAQVLSWNGRDAAEAGPFGLHRRIISRFSGLSKSDPPWAVRRKVSAAVQRLDAGKSCINWLVARCTSVLETSNRSPERLGAEEWRDVWRYFLEAVAHDGPIVLIVDDLHLEDTATRELVGLIARLPVRIPLTVIAGAAPELLRHADWSSDRRFATTVLLDRPSDEELACSDEDCLPVQ
ncbi:BTAD domain-containing putative transcriptional regulator [Streptomyces sp. NPDC101213]|uniref:BTAD domain-containing putative transcriptional regulator n=1 Tax=Streptomyces sp. NPDC101213 TaxID=3366130 RepID=UPI00381FB009